MKTFAEFTQETAAPAPSGLPTFVEVKEGADETTQGKDVACMSESMKKKMDEMYEALCEDMKACHEDDSERKAEDWLKECMECWKGMEGKLVQECESYMAALH